MKGGQDVDTDAYNLWYQVWLEIMKKA